MPQYYEYTRADAQRFARAAEHQRDLKPKQAQNVVAGLLGFSNWHDLRRSASLGIFRSRVSPDELRARIKGTFEEAPAATEQDDVDRT